MSLPQLLKEAASVLREYAEDSQSLDAFDVKDHGPEYYMDLVELEELANAK